jgi:hypothetical protein
MEFTDIRASEPAAGIPPWQDPAWAADAEDWITAGCARAGLARTGTALARGRPYSVVARVPTSGGTVWFKASPPPASFEPALIGALADWFPERFPAPVALDLDRAWSLTTDGGPTLAQARERTEDLSAWHAMLRGYARLQYDLAPYAGELLDLGLPDLRPDSVPGQFDKLLADPATERAVGAPDGITADRYHALQAVAPRLRDWCGELDDLAIPVSLDHADMHPNNVFAAANNPFDWGDAAVAHPFCSLLIALRTGAVHAGRPPRSPELAALTDDYVRTWLDAGHPRPAIERSLSLAIRIAPLGRALAWGRVFPCYLGESGLAGHAIRALAAVLDPDPVDPAE